MSVPSPTPGPPVRPLHGALLLAIRVGAELFAAGCVVLLALVVALHSLIHLLSLALLAVGERLGHSVELAGRLSRWAADGGWLSRSRSRDSDPDAAADREAAPRP